MYNLVNMENSHNIVFGSRLKAARQNAHETQQSAADTFGISLRGYCRWEKGEREPNYSILIAIADHYGVTTDWLLGRIDAKFSDE